MNGKKEDGVLSGKTVLITGAGGFIGSHLTELCLAQGAKVRALTHYRGRRPEGWLGNNHHENLAVIPGDVCDPFQIREVTTGCDIVFHLAALIGIPYSYSAPSQYVDTNISGTLNVLQAARELGVERLVHTSTSEVYGTAISVPISEDHPLQAQSPYSATKISADQMALSYHCSFDLPVVIVRPFNTYGPRQSARAIIPSVLSQLIKGTESLQVGSLTPTRDMNFVTDTARGFLAAGIATDEVCGEVINLGTGDEHSIQQLIDMMIDVTGSDARVVTDQERTRPGKSEVFRLVADNRKAATLLDWSPQVGILDGLKKTAEWIRQNPDEFNPDRYSI